MERWVGWSILWESWWCCRRKWNFTCVYYTTVHLYTFGVTFLSLTLKKNKEKKEIRETAHWGALKLAASHAIYSGSRYLLRSCPYPFEVCRTCPFLCCPILAACKSSRIYPSRRGAPLQKRRKNEQCDLSSLKSYRDKSSSVACRRCKIVRFQFCRRCATDRVECPPPI